MLSDKKILITGVTGTAPMPLAQYLAGNNEVWGVARFSNPELQNTLEENGIITRTIDLSRRDLSALPDDFTHVIQCAHTRMGPGDFQQAIQTNAISAGHVLQHCRKATAAIVMSSGAVYSPRNEHPHYPFEETDDVGRSFTPWAPTSPVSKLSLEAIASFCAEAFDLPTTIVRLNIVYGPRGGMPVQDMDGITRGEKIMFFADPYPVNPIHSDDMCDQLEALFDAAGRPATLVNWCGDETISRQQWCARASQLAGRPANTEHISTPEAPRGSVLNAERRLSITGPCKADFWDSFDTIYQQRYGKRESQ